MVLKLSTVCTSLLHKVTSTFKSEVAKWSARHEPKLPEPNTRMRLGVSIGLPLLLSVNGGNPVVAASARMRSRGSFSESEWDIATRCLKKENMRRSLLG